MTISDWIASPWAKVFILTLVVAVVVFLIRKMIEKRRSSRIILAIPESDYKDYDKSAGQVLPYAMEHSNLATEDEIDFALTRAALLETIHVRAVPSFEEYYCSLDGKIFETHIIRLSENRIVSRFGGFGYRVPMFISREIISLWPPNRKKIKPSS